MADLIKWEYNEKRNAIVSPSESESDTNDVGYYGGKLICESVFDKDNAKIIIAAHDMLEACKEALKMYDEIEPVGGWQFIRDSLNDAINKATE